MTKNKLTPFKHRDTFEAKERLERDLKSAEKRKTYFCNKCKDKGETGWIWKTPCSCRKTNHSE